MNDSTPLPTIDCEIAEWPRRYQKVDFVIGSGKRGNSGSNGDLGLAARAACSDEAVGRWRKDLWPLYPAALDLEFRDPETGWKVRPNPPQRWLIGPFTPGREVSLHQGGVLNSDDFLWLGTLNVGKGEGHPRDASNLSTRFSERALRVAVMANGGALVALAFTVQTGDNSSSAGMAAAVVLALGLLFATISLLAYLNFQLADAFWSVLTTKRVFEPKGPAIAITNPAYQTDQTKEVRIPSQITNSFWLATISGAASYAALTLAAFWL